MRGIDLGNSSCHLIYDEQYIDAGLTRINVTTYVSQIKSLLGKKFSDPELQLALDYVPFKVIEGPNGCPLIQGRCKREDRAFTPVEILAMLFSSSEFQARGAYSYFSSCIGIPVYFTDEQKRDVHQAVAWLPQPFRLLDETTAMVVAHGETHFIKPQCIMAFVDFGHTSMQVCFAVFKDDGANNAHRASGRKRSVNIFYKGYARTLGGQEFDKVLFQHFASKIEREHKIDVYGNSRACVRLREACEGLKKDLSKNNEASLCIENFIDSIDVKGSITGKEFENLSILILKNIEVALKMALSESGLNAKMIDFVEEVGKGSSMPAIKNILTEIFGKKERNATCYYEHIAMGCAMPEELLDIMGTNEVRDLTTTTGAGTSQKCLWRKTMDKDGHLLTFLNAFLEKNMHSISRSMKTDNESYWLSNAYAEFSYSELLDATNNFHESLKLGEGGFGIVYKGLVNEVPVAIKVLKKESSQGATEFTREVRILRNVSHPNLVKLIGACEETCALIYEYLPNGSLEDRLRCKNNTPPLSWQVRVRIAFEICSALSFLHSSKPHGIVHGDLKPDNVLLDSNNTSKICDFGQCRQLDWTASASIACHWTEYPKGTLAYMDPEYLSTGKITPQYDNYSFGIMLLRILTCKNPRGLRHVVEEAQKKGLLKTLIDASAGPWPFKEAKKMISLGLRCSSPVRMNRPDLSTEVLKEMKSMLDVASASMSA